MNAGILAARLAKAQDDLSAAVERLRERFDAPDRAAVQRPPTRDVNVRRLFELEDLSHELGVLAESHVRPGQERGNPRPVAAAEAVPNAVDPVAGVEVVHVGYPDNPGPPVLKNPINRDVFGNPLPGDFDDAYKATAVAADRSMAVATELDAERRSAEQPPAEPMGFPENEGAPVQNYVGQERDGRLNFDVFGNPVSPADNAAFDNTKEAAARLDEADAARDQERQQAAKDQAEKDADLPDHLAQHAGPFPDNKGARVVGAHPGVVAREEQNEADQERARLAQETQAEVSDQSRELGLRLRDLILQQLGEKSEPLGDQAGVAREDEPEVGHMERPLRGEHHEAHKGVVEGDPEAAREHAEMHDEESAELVGQEPSVQPEEAEKIRAEQRESAEKIDQINTSRESEDDDLGQNVVAESGGPLNMGAAGDPAQPVLDESDESDDDLDGLPLNNRQKSALREAGVYSLKDIQGRSDEELLEVDGIGPAKLEQLRQRAPRR